MLGLLFAAAALIWWRPWAGEGGSAASDGDDAKAQRAKGPGADKTASAQAALRRQTFRLAAEASAVGSGALVPLTGVVRDRTTGAPVPGIDVIFRHPSGESTATSGGGGEFSIQVMSGRQDVRAYGDGYFAPSQTLIVGPRAAGKIVIEVVALAKVKGTVVRRALVRNHLAPFAAEPVAGAKVSFTPKRRADRGYLTNEEIPSHTMTGPDGSFELAVFPGQVALVAEEGGTKAGANVGPLEPGATIGDVTLELKVAASLAGTVKDAAGQAVAAATVVAISRSPGSAQKLTTVTDDDGRFSFEAISPGAVRVEANLAGGGVSPSVRVDLGPGQSKDVALILLPEEALTGRVIREGGAAVADAEISIKRRSSKLSAMTTTSATGGDFRFDGLGRGRYGLTVRSRDGEVARAEVEVPAAAEVVVTMRAMGGIRGVVTGDDGRPLPAFDVTVLGGTSPEGAGIPAPTPASRHVRAATGEYEIYPLEPGRYQIRVSAEGAGAPSSFAVSVPESGWGEGNVQLVAGATISGFVHNDTGEPIAGARVALQDTGAAAVFSDSAGRFTLHGVAPGPRAVAVTHRDYVGTAQSVAATLGDNEIAVELSHFDVPSFRDGNLERKVEVQGIGVYLRHRGGHTEVFRAVKRAPADKAGIRGGDHVVAVDGIDTSGLFPAQIAGLLRGPVGSSVDVEVDRGGKILRFAITRSSVQSTLNPSALLACGRVISEPFI